MVLQKISNTPASKTKPKRKNHTLLKVAGSVAGLALLAAPLVMGLAGVVEAGGAAAALESVEAEGGAGALAANSRTPLLSTPRPPPPPINPLVRYSHQYPPVRVKGAFPYHGPLPKTLSKMQEIQGVGYTRFKSLKSQLHLRNLESTFETIERNTLVSPTQGNPLLKVPSNLITEHLKPPITPITPIVPIGPMTQEQARFKELAQFEELLPHLEHTYSNPLLPKSSLLNKVDRMFDIYTDNMTLTSSKKAIAENKYLDALFGDPSDKDLLSHHDIRRGRQLMKELQIHQEPELLTKINTLDKQLQNRCTTRFCSTSLALTFGVAVPTVIISAILDIKSQKNNHHGK